MQKEALCMCMWGPVKPETQMNHVEFDSDAYFFLLWAGILSEVRNIHKPALCKIIAFDGELRFKHTHASTLYVCAFSFL